MRPQYVMFLGLLLAGGTLIGLTSGGNWLDSSDLSTINSMSVFKDASLFGTWSVTVPNVDFFFTGMKSLMMFDFAFFTGGLQIFQWFLVLTIGLGALWGLYTVVIGIVQGVFSR